MKPSEEQKVMLEHTRDNVNLPGNCKEMASDLLENYDPVKHAEMDKYLKEWEAKKEEGD